MVRTAVLAAILSLRSAAAMAQQTCTTRADGSFNCTTSAAGPPAAPALTAAASSRRGFQPDDAGLLRIPTIDGETLFHCDSTGPCKMIGVNPAPLNR